MARYGTQYTFDEHEVTIEGQHYTAYRYQFEDDPETGEAGATGTEYYSAAAMRFATGPEYYTQEGVIDAGGRLIVYREDGTLAPFREDAITEEAS
ncbi:MAG: hypothetical protein ACRDJ9_15290 [Dehalococcoidia bacterium]